MRERTEAGRFTPAKSIRCERAGPVGQTARKIGCRRHRRSGIYRRAMREGHDMRGKFGGVGKEISVVLCQQRSPGTRPIKKRIWDVSRIIGLTDPRAVQKVAGAAFRSSHFPKRKRPTPLATPPSTKPFTPLRRCHHSQNQL